MNFITAIAWIHTVSTASAFAGQSPFWGRPLKSADASATGYRASLLKYENSRDGARDSNVWSVLSTTERWISDILASAETDSGTNPYSRKEVNYVCETDEEIPMIAANIFKRLREARELGHNHGLSEEDHRTEQGSSYRPHTLRQTQVMVIPGNKNLCDSFEVFDDFINAVNMARRNARDYLTDASLEKLDQELAGEQSRDWSVSVNCAHLHPDFGKKTAEEALQEMKEEEERGETALHAKDYAEKRLLARQSPYPTIVLEVRATPPPDFGAFALPQPPPMATDEDATEDEDEDEDTPQAYSYNRKELLQMEVTAADMQKLEALFGQGAAKDHPAKQTGKNRKKEDSFYDGIGKSIDEVSTISHMQMAQEWIRDNDEKFSPVTSAFMEADITEIDHAYEFVFTNLAMMQQQYKQDSVHGSRRQYLVMPHFLSSSATSLEKFTKEVMNMVNTLPDLREKVKLSTFHPEHVQQERRSQNSIVCLQWTEVAFPQACPN